MSLLIFLLAAAAFFIMNAAGIAFFLFYIYTKDFSLSLTMAQL
jgi:hypothetical protein